MQDSSPSSTPSNSPLFSFLAAAKAGGANDEFLVTLLQRQGWPTDEIFDALRLYWEQTTGIVAPRRGAFAESSRDAFLYLLSFLALGIWASALGTVLFQLVNLWVPDGVMSTHWYSARSTISWSMAALVVSFPLYLMVMRVLVRESEANPGRMQSAVRKWLTYLALLVAAGTVVGDLICFVGYFLMGEISARFVLKSVVVLVICGGIFAYYLGSLPGTSSGVAILRKSPHRLFALISAVVVSVAFLLGMSATGNPVDQRRLQADQRRVQDLQQIAHGVERWHRAATTPNASEGTLGETMPESLEDLRKQQRIAGIADPETGLPYRYELRESTQYALCAEFATDTVGMSTEGYLGREESVNWRHPKGEHCFVIDAAKPVPY